MTGISEQKEVNIMGMTDLQFKAHLKQLIRSLEWAESKGTLEEVLQEIEKLKRDLQETIES